MLSLRSSRIEHVFPSTGTIWSQNPFFNRSELRHWSNSQNTSGCLLETRAFHIKIQTHLQIVGRDEHLKKNGV